MGLPSYATCGGWNNLTYEMCIVCKAESLNNFSFEGLMLELNSVQSSVLSSEVTEKKVYANGAQRLLSYAHDRIAFSKRKKKKGIM
jgi:hypothetical protein